VPTTVQLYRPPTKDFAAYYTRREGSGREGSSREGSGREASGREASGREVAAQKA
jgi:hypothetical protein